MVSIMCLRAVGEFSRTNGMPAAEATSRKRMAGGTPARNPAITRKPAKKTGTRMLLPRRPDLRFPRHLFLLLLRLLLNLLVLCHGRLRLLPIPRSLVGARQLVVQAAVLIQLDRFLEVGNG